MFRGIQNKYQLPVAEMLQFISIKEYQAENMPKEKRMSDTEIVFMIAHKQAMREAEAAKRQVLNQDSDTEMESDSEVEEDNQPRRRFG